MSRDDAPDNKRDARLFKLLRRWLSGSRGMRSKHGANLALDILAANGIDELTIVRDGRRLHVSPHDKVIASSLIRSGTFGRENFDALAGVLSTSGIAPAELTAVNVGANIGTACLNAYDIGFRRFVAIEPEPENFRLLERNLAELSDADFRCIRAAAGETTGRAVLHRHAANLGAHSLAGAKAGSEGDTIEVDVAPLTAFVDVGRPFILIVDVEGFEPQVIRGGAPIIERGCRAMMLEITPARYSSGDAEDLCRRLAAFSDRYVLLPDGELHRTRDLARLMHERSVGHFDIALVR